MGSYTIVYEKKNVCVEGSKPEGGYKFKVTADDFFDATKEAVPVLLKVGFMSCLSDIWNAKILDKDGKEYEILKDGGWLVDGEGKQKGSLEELVKK